MAAGQSVEAAPLQGPEALGKGYGDRMVLEADGRVYYAADAWLRMLHIAPWYVRWLTIAERSTVTRAIAAWGYGIVERYRLRWFGTRDCVVPKR